MVGICEFLKRWKGDRTNVECAKQLGIDKRTFGEWLFGHQFPPPNRRSVFADKLGVAHAELEALIAAERIMTCDGSEKVGIRIDTVEQTKQVLHEMQPTTQADA